MNDDATTPQQPHHPAGPPSPVHQPAPGWTRGGADPHPAQPPREPRRRRTGLAAAVVATSLLVGGGAGLGGAAWWD
ncbi:MAG TPA: hypothetical protein VFJ83_00080, partial [Nocardioidaceae bacterium]|nr:hypothetical protein [Nocardioidaceae bacterium]